jgi:hypothetical protein
MFEVEDVRSSEEKQRDINVFHSVQHVQRNWQSLAIGCAPLKSQLKNMNPNELCLSVDKFADAYGDALKRKTESAAAAEDFFETVGNRAIERLDDFSLDEILAILNSFVSNGIRHDSLFEAALTVMKEELVHCDSLDVMRDVWQASVVAQMFDRELRDLLKKNLDKLGQKQPELLSEIQTAITAIEEERIH